MGYRCWLCRSNISRLGNGKTRFIPLKWVANGSGFSLIFSLTAKAWPKPTEHQTAQYTAPTAQKMTAKHGKTGLENRKTGSSPVLSTIKSSEIKRFRSFLWQAAPIKISAVFLVFSMVSAFWGKVFGACCFILLVAAVQPKKILWDLWNFVRSARFCQRSPL